MADAGTGAVRETLRAAGGILRLSAVAAGALWWLAVCLGAWLVLLFLDNLLRIPPGLRLPLAVAGAVLVVCGLARRVCRPVVRRTRVERTARALETGYGVADNAIINACQLEGSPLTRPERSFAGRTIADASGVLSGIGRDALWRRRLLMRWGVFAGAVALVWALYWIVFPRYAGNALARYVRPLGDIPPVGSYVLRTAPDRDVTVYEGEDLQVSARFERPGAASVRGRTPALLVWAEGARRVGTAPSAGQNADMLAVPGRPGEARYAFRNLRRPFAFRVFVGDTYSPSIRVRVRPLPRVRASTFRVTPPRYTGRPGREAQGPPARLVGLPGSTVAIELELDRDVDGLSWRAGGADTAFARAGSGWIAQAELRDAGPYRVRAACKGAAHAADVAVGDVALDVDRAPTIEFVTESRNRYVRPGETVTLAVEAADDFGVRRIGIASRRAEEGSPMRGLKEWRYGGPPGPAGPVKEQFALRVDPAGFVPGAAYIVEALCFDFRAGGEPGRARPVVLRVTAWDELSLPGGDPLTGAFDLLRRTVQEQRRANALTSSLRTFLQEALQGETLEAHRGNMRERQAAARDLGAKALAAMREREEGAPFTSRLGTLVEGEMAWVLDHISRLDVTAGPALDARVVRIYGRQEYILHALIELLGQIAERRSKSRAPKPATDDTPQVTTEETAERLREDLEDFARSQRRILERSRTLMDAGPEDLTDEEEDILGELAREEAKWAQFLEEKMTDFGKLPLQDFADGSVADEFNEVFQEIQLAAKSLYERKIELAVPQEQAGLESAEELVHNLERWLPDTPDYIKWLMEDPPTPPDVPLAELPSELEDIIGELLDREEEMTEDIEDVTSAWMDSIDKGAGWDAVDGPISSMGAKGVTGNQLPNRHEVGGRSGEGRTGRSHGQMVESAADGRRGGRDTPTRLTPSPFEPGSIEDGATEDTGGATGGGKLSGFSGEGLRGPAPPPRSDPLQRLAGQQARIRQEAEVLALKLRAYHLPTGDLEVSVEHMKRVEIAARDGSGGKLRQSFNRAVDALRDADEAVRREAGLFRENAKIPDHLRSDILDGLRDGMPPGYEDMAAEYFRLLAERERD